MYFHAHCNNVLAQIIKNDGRTLKCENLASNITNLVQSGNLHVDRGKYVSF